MSIEDKGQVDAWVEALMRVLEPMPADRRAEVLSRIVDRLDLCPKCFSEGGKWCCYDSRPGS